MKKRIVIEVEIDPSEQSDKVLHKVFDATVTGIEKAKMILGAKFEILHQRIEDVQEEAKA